jgi:hypothetical protein
LVVIAIIAMLLAIVMPAMNKAKMYAQGVVINNRNVEHIKQPDITPSLLSDKYYSGAISMYNSCLAYKLPVNRFIGDDIHGCNTVYRLVLNPLLDQLGVTFFQPCMWHSLKHRMVPVSKEILLCQSVPFRLILYNRWRGSPFVRELCSKTMQLKYNVKMNLKSLSVYSSTVNLFRHAYESMSPPFLCVFNRN